MQCSPSDAVATGEVNCYNFDTVTSKVCGDDQPGVAQRNDPWLVRVASVKTSELHYIISVCQKYTEHPKLSKRMDKFWNGMYTDHFHPPYRPFTHSPSGYLRQSSQLFYAISQTFQIVVYTTAL